MLLFHPKLTKMTVKMNLENTFEPFQSITWVRKVLLIPGLDVVRRGYIEGSLVW